MCSCSKLLEPQARPSDVTNRATASRESGHLCQPQFLGAETGAKQNALQTGISQGSGAGGQEGAGQMETPLLSVVTCGGNGVPCYWGAATGFGSPPTALSGVYLLNEGPAVFPLL